MAGDINLDSVTDVADLDQAILESGIEGVQEAWHDSERVLAMPLKDRMELSDKIRQQNATNLPTLGVIFRRFIPPGTL